MDPQELRARLSGVIAFPVTPFQPDLSLDLAGLRRNVEKLVEHPLCAIVAGGGTGEMFSLTAAEHQQVLKTVIEAVGGRVPVLAAAGFGNQQGVELAEQATRLGAQGVLAFPPYYPNADSDGLFAYYQAIGAATTLGLLIYSRDWANFNPSAVEKLTAIPNLIAWKDGQGDIRRYQMIQKRVGDRLHWIGGAGDDLVPGYYALGIRTYTSSIANVAPRLSLLLHEHAAAGNRAELDRLMTDCVVPLYALRARRKGYEVSVMKTMMDEIGLTGGPVRPPLVEITDSERAELKAMLPVWKPYL